MELKQLMIDLWQSACIDRPQRDSCRVEDGCFVFTISGNPDRWNELCKAAAVPSCASEQTDGDTLTVRWPSHADYIFAANGPLAVLVDGYEVRAQQIHVGRMVQRSIEMNETAVIEAGTGTGKSFAYAAVCLAMDKRVVISTSNKALQMLLWQKDIPLLCKVFPGKKVALVQGKSNYACRMKVEGPLAGGMTIANPELAQWYPTTKTGTVEEIPFAVDWKELSAITVDDECAGKNCPHYLDCFYYCAKAERQQADVLITNHMLLCMDALYPGAEILPEPDVVVVDEAHKLPDYARTALGAEFSLRSIRRAIDVAESYTDIDDRVWQRYFALNAAVEGKVYSSEDRGSHIGLHRDETIPAAMPLVEELSALADEIWPLECLPADPIERKAARDADKVRSAADRLRPFTEGAQEGYVRWIDTSDELTLSNTPFDVSGFVGRLAGFETVTARTADHTRCARCGRTLTADTVAILDNQPYGPDCIRHVDPFGDAERVALSDWLGASHEVATTERIAHSTPYIFTSATIAAPTFEHFLRDCGIERALQMQVDSPFNYRDNALLFVPNGATPDPRDREYSDFLVGALRDLVLASQGGAFLLFTSLKNMRECADALRELFTGLGFPVYVQGEGLSKLEIARRFKADGNAVLFATKSFFEGVSIDGQSLRLVAIDKIPFAAPSPLSQAQSEALQRYALDTLGMSEKQAKWYPFEALSLPQAILDLKQGVGRLIRTGTDEGVMAILDPRVRSQRYGRNSILPSLPPAPLVHSVYAVEGFFAERRQAIARPTPAPRATPTDPSLTREEALLWA